MMIILTLHLKQKYIIKSKLEEYVRNRLLAKKNSLKIIKVVLFTIDNHKKDILAVVYKKKTIQTQDKWNQLNIMDIQSMLGTNHRLPLSHIAKSNILLKKQINVLISYLLDI